MRDEEITMPDGLNLKLTNSALSAFMEKFDKDKSKVEVKKNEIVIDFDGDGRADQSINMKTKDLKYGYSDYQNGVTKNSKADGKYTYIDFDGDGRMDAKIKSKKLSKNNMSDPITLKGNSREVQELIEQRYVLDFAYQQVISKEVPDLKEGQKIKKMMAAIDKKLNSYNAGVGTEEFKLKNDAIQVKKEPVKVADNAANGAAPVDVVDEAAAGLAAAEAKKKKAEEKKEIGVDSKIMVTNERNKNGSIDGTVTNVAKDDKGKITSLTLKSAKGNDFTYEYDAKTDRYVNKKENKYYIMQEDGSLVRDNKLGKQVIKSGGGEGDKTQKTMATSGSGRYTKVVDGKTLYYAADDTELKEDYYKSKEAIAEKTNVVDAFNKPTDLKFTDLMYFKGNYTDDKGRIFKKETDKEGKIKFVEIAAVNPATLPPFIPIGAKKDATQATTPETTVAQASVKKDWSAELKAASPSSLQWFEVGNQKIEKNVSEELLTEIAKSNNPKLAADAIIAASNGVGTNDTLFKSVISSINNQSYYDLINKELKKQNSSMGIEQYINSEFSSSPSNLLALSAVVKSNIETAHKERTEKWAQQQQKYGNSAYSRSR